MAASFPDQSLTTEGPVVTFATAQDFILAFNACSTPKEALRLFPDVTKALTACVAVQADSLQVCCTTLAGELVEERSFSSEATLAEFVAALQRKQAGNEIPTTCLTLVADDGAEVSEASLLRDCARLTVKASLSPDDVGRLMYRAADSVSVQLLGQCLGHHDGFWKRLAVSYPENFDCFAGMDVVAAIRAYLWRFRLPGEAAQIERIVDGFARSYYRFNSAGSKSESQEGNAETQEPGQRRRCWSPGVSGWYVRQPLSGPKLLPCCVHCGALDGDSDELLLCKGCEVVHFCSKCRRHAARYGHAVVGMIGYGRACVSARYAAGSLGPDLMISYQRNVTGNGPTETAAVSEESLDWEISSPFKSQDSVMVLAYAIIMLTTNLHSANVKDKMKKHEFIKQNRGVNGGGNFPGDFLAKVYDDIQREELKVMRNVD